jgi:alpha-beta hydrolase superfamily lysophospholipase
MQRREATLTGQGGVSLYIRAWLPDMPAVGVIVIAHGLAEHCGRYEHVAANLVSQGYAVYALDHRGHGKSGGRRANIDRFAYLIEDLDLLFAQARAAHPGLPVTLIGHSMGGAIAFAYALRHQQALKGLVLTAPALGTKLVPRLQLLFVRFLSVVLPNMGAITLPATAVSRDPAVVQAYETDPLNYRGAVPARTVAELFAAMGSFPAAAPALTLPVLILHGTSDLLVPREDTLPVVDRMGSRDKTLNVYEGLYHEVFNEPEQAQVLADLDAWLAARR